MSRPLFFADLDDTLFQTAAKIDGPVEALRIASHATNGRHSYFTASQARLIDWLNECAEVVPVTARGTEAFSRVAIPRSSYAVLANGAVVLNASGELEPEWEAEVVRRAAPHAKTLAEILGLGRAFAESRAIAIRSWIVEESATPIYAVFKSETPDLSGLPRIAEHLKALYPGWRFGLNGNNLSVTVPNVSKALAVAWLLAERLDAAGRPVFGMGDSLSDIEFMRLCDFMVVPARSQIAAGMPR